MRCQLHSEVAKCLADEDHLTTAIEHLDKVLYNAMHALCLYNIENISHC